MILKVELENAATTVHTMLDNMAGEISLNLEV
jgi:hypothetical protein